MSRQRVTPEAVFKIGDIMRSMRELTKKYKKIESIPEQVYNKLSYKQKFMLSYYFKKKKKEAGKD